MLRLRFPLTIPEILKKDVRLAYAIYLFHRGIVSVKRTAELAGMSLYDFLAELRRRGIQAYPYSGEELREELGIESLQ